MKIIILAPEDDNHTIPIKWALEKAAYNAVCWAGIGWTEERQASLIQDKGDTLILGEHTVEPGDVVWIRRPEPPFPNPKTSEADKKFAASEYRSFFHSVMFMLENLPVWCINPFTASRRMVQKPVQLQLARKCGLIIPDTLMSNDPQEVKKFLTRDNSRSICKGFTPHVWKKDGQGTIAITETFEVQKDRLPADDVLTYAPAIYQDRVPKEFDVRTVLMGNSIYSYSLKNTQKALDWRQDCTLGHVSVEPIATPPEVEKSIRAFMRQSGICFGSLDFGVDAHGQWWFLEINEQGQFLWLDQFTPSIRILGKFCAFLTAGQNSTLPLEAREDLFPTVQDFDQQKADLTVVPTERASNDVPFLSSEA